MKYLFFVWKDLWRNRTRTVLTLLSITFAFVLFGALRGITASLDRMLANTSETRLYVQSRVAFGAGLPISYQSQIASVPGVRDAAYLDMLVAYFREPRNSVLASAVDFERYLAVSPTIVMSAAARQAMQQTRDGAVIGRALAEKWGWKVGDRVPLLTRGPPGQPPRTWEFQIVGVYEDRLGARDFFIHYDHFNEKRLARKGTASMYFVSIDDPAHTARIATDIDRRFANSSAETFTQSEKDFMRTQLGQLGDVNFYVEAIIAAVLVTILAVTAVVMSQSIREGLPAFATLMALGYTPRLIGMLVTAETLMLCLAGAALGIGLSALLFPAVFSSFGLPAFPLPGSVVASGLLAAALIGLLSAVPPIWSTRHFSVIEALSGRRQP